VAVTGLVATIDNLAAGLSLGAAGLRAGPLLVGPAICGYAAGVLGLVLGRRLGGRLGGGADSVAGAVFVLIGLGLIVGAIRG
jgi:putative Mn2+ efflux pump MntP